MIHIHRLILDIILGTLNTLQDIYMFFNWSKTPASLVAQNVYWCTQSKWMDRLIAYKQLDLWTLQK